eukprot:PhF_6_TR42653/c0_g1_i3/m.64232/K13248/PHOSPHO2; pyridoxal phosphate phosphatase PHOSPHO2
MSDIIQTKWCVLFDFDHSLVDENTDTFVPERLDPTLTVQHFIRDQYKVVQWTTLMDAVLGKLHDMGVGSPADIKRVLQDIPFHVSSKRIVERIRERKRTQKDIQAYIISDANALYIQSILENESFTDVFTNVFTNPTRVDTGGRVRVSPFSTGHTCHVCTTVNMCKGDIYEGTLLKHREADGHTVFVCDGRNDLCLVLRLSAGDYALVRKGDSYGLWKHVKERMDAHEVRCTVVFWETYEELEGWFVANIFQT